MSCIVCERTDDKKVYLTRPHYRGDIFFWHGSLWAESKKTDKNGKTTKHGISRMTPKYCPYCGRELTAEIEKWEKLTGNKWGELLSDGNAV